MSSSRDPELLNAPPRRRTRAGAAPPHGWPGAGGAARQPGPGRLQAAKPEGFARPPGRQRSHRGEGRGTRRPMGDPPRDRGITHTLHSRVSFRLPPRPTLQELHSHITRHALIRVHAVIAHTDTHGSATGSTTALWAYGWPLIGCYTLTERIPHQSMSCSSS